MLKLPRASSWVAFCSLALSACATTPIDGFQLDSGDYNAAREKVERVASQELDCPRGQIQLAVADERRSQVTQFNARGCGKQALYIRTTENRWHSFDRSITTGERER